MRRGTLPSVSSTDNPGNGVHQAAPPTAETPEPVVTEAVSPGATPPDPEPEPAAGRAGTGDAPSRKRLAAVSEEPAAVSEEPAAVSEEPAAVSEEPAAVPDEGTASSEAVTPEAGTPDAPTPGDAALADPTAEVAPAAEDARPPRRHLPSRRRRRS